MKPRERIIKENRRMKGKDVKKKEKKKKNGEYE